LVPDLDVTMLDFTELGQDGVDLELLVRELLLSMGYRVDRSGKDRDDGRDLLCDEPGEEFFGAKLRRWLISCKHKARSGASVGTDELGEFVTLCQQHRASGFLLVCTTQA
jgi:hypothetical protein